MAALTSVGLSWPSRLVSAAANRPWTAVWTAWRTSVAWSCLSLLVSKVAARFASMFGFWLVSWWRPVLLELGLGGPDGVADPAASVLRKASRACWASSWREDAVAVRVGAEEEAADEQVAGVDRLLLRDLAVVVLVGHLEEHPAGVLQVLQAVDRAGDVARLALDRLARPTAGRTVRPQRQSTHPEHPKLLHEIPPSIVHASSVRLGGRRRGQTVRPVRRRVRHRRTLQGRCQRRRSALDPENRRTADCLNYQDYANELD